MSAEGAKVCESGFIPMPEFERSFMCRERRMRCAVFDMNRGLDSERPIPIAKIRINEKCAGYAGECEIAAFRDAVLTWRIGDGLFVGNAGGFAIGLEFALDEFRGIVDAEEGDFFVAKVLCDRAKLVEAIRRLIPGGDEEKGNITRVTTNKQNEIFKASIARRKRTTNVTMNSFDAACSAVRGD